MDQDITSDKNRIEFANDDPILGITKSFSLRVGSRIEIIYRLLKTLSRLTDSISFTIGDNDVFARVMDNQHISLIDFQLRKVLFESFVVSNPPVNIVFNAYNILTILSRSIKNAKRVELMSQDVEKNKLIITSEGRSRAEYTIECEPFEGNYPELPKIDFKA